jgi:hypothetical protein
MMTLISKKLRPTGYKNQSRSVKMNKEFVEKNYEIALLASIFLYIIFPVYIVLFLICSIVALGRGQLYKDRLKEFLKTLSDAEFPAVETEMPPIARARSNRKRRGSLS